MRNRTEWKWGKTKSYRMGERSRPSNLPHPIAIPYCKLRRLIYSKENVPKTNLKNQMQNQEISSNTNKVDQNLYKIDETIITYMILKKKYIYIYI